MAEQENRVRGFVDVLPALLTTCLIVYASLFPFQGWRMPDGSILGFLIAPWPAHVSRADLLANVLGYAPLGFFLALLRRFSHPWRAVVGITLGGTLLSFSMESLQTLLPSRTASNLDLLTNGFGTLLGAVMGQALKSSSQPGARLRAVRAALFLPGRVVDVGLAAILTWALSQLTPFVPSFDISSIRQGWAPLWHALHGETTFDWYAAFTYAFTIAGLGVLARSLGKTARSALLVSMSFPTAVLLFKPFVQSRQLSAEAACGLVAGLVSVAALRINRTRLAYAAIALITAGYVASEIGPVEGTYHRFNWIPLAAETENTIKGFGEILSTLWPFAAVACATAITTPVSLRRRTAAVGALVTAVFVFALEWAQQHVPGRYGDVTTVLIAAAGWSLAATVIAMEGHAVDSHENTP